jgi:Tfp pilus assembly protein PilX
LRQRSQSFEGQIRRMRSFVLILILFLLVVIGGGFLALGMFPLPLHQHQVHEVLPASAIAKG